jgi:LmbE family N-acetylglucosaminyl deacetylase
MTRPKDVLILIFFFFGVSSTLTFGQSVPSSVIYQQILQLEETKRILYVAAHPDDENTRLISYLVNGVHAEVAYLSLTRGDGGQNLIGKELGVELGQIRTQELLRARATDGGRQYFTRALDFGYSKNPSETLQNWDKQKVLADVVWAIRKFQPDIIITRFNTIPGVTHGHHTTSAILAGEAFDLAGSSNAFPEQLQWVKPWQAKRIFFNAYNFGGEFIPEESKKYHVFEVGGYDPILGETFHQIAADSRTMHKSQGFGATAGIGPAKDYIQLVGGEDYSDDAFDGVEDRWQTVAGAELVRDKLEQLISDFNFVKPEQNIPGLLEIRSDLLALNSKEIWLAEKVAKLDRAILMSLGLEVEYNVRKELGYPVEEIQTELVINNPSSIAIDLTGFRSNGQDYPDVKGELVENRLLVMPVDITIPQDANYSQPYWLEKPIDGALFDVADQQLIGKPFNDPAISGELNFTILGQKLVHSVPLQYKYNDQVDGEVKQPFTIVPEVELLVAKDNVFLVSGADPTLTVSVSFRDQLLEGELDFVGLDPSQFSILATSDVLTQKRRVYQVAFSPNGSGLKEVTARFTTVDGKSYTQHTRSISYKHIPNLTYLVPSSFNLIQADWKTSAAEIGYIPGAGDDVPGVLTALGYKVTLVGPENYDAEYLSQFKAIVVGIRAYNTNEFLAANQAILLDYVRDGGNLIVQYNTSSPLLTRQIGPFPFTIGRDRVSVQGSPVTAEWKSPVLSQPNQMNEQDMDGWVQERGLYFATAIDPQYQTPFVMQDPGEAPSKGALLVGKYGKGTFVYTGISFFRQLPAGVPGAIKLFINLIEQ